MRVDAYASLPHYAEHIAPIWRALPDEVRGDFYGTGRAGREWGPAPPARWAKDRVVLVASWPDYMRAGPRPCIYVEHGAGQTYEGDPRAAAHESYAGGRGYERVVLFVCPNQRVSRRWVERYGEWTAVVGCPKLDAWHSGSRGGLRSPEHPTVAVTFHWDCPLVPETRSAWRHYDEALDGLRSAVELFGGVLLGHGHPRLYGALERRWRALGVEHTPHLADVLDRADVLVADNTSAMWEFASLDRPLVVLDAPWYRRDVEHGLRFWTHADAGVRIDSPRLLVAAIQTALADPDGLRASRAAAVAEVYPVRDGRAAERAAAAILSRLEEPMPNPFAAKRSRRGAERQTAAEQVESRLRALGATDDELADFRGAWGDPDTDAEARDWLLRADDHTLARAIAASRGEDPDAVREVRLEDGAPGDVVMGALPDEGPGSFGYVEPREFPGTGEPMEAVEVAVGEEAELTGEPAEPFVVEVPEGTVDEMLAWVGDDRGRAAAVLNVERDRDTPRKTLVEPLERLLTGADG